jgi:hypothetical protein
MDPIRNSTTTIVDPMLALAALMIDNDHAREKSETEALDQARAEQRRAMDEAVEQLYDAADAVTTGALLRGALTVAGGAASTAGSVGTTALEGETTPLLTGLTSGGNALRELAAPVFDLVGQAARMQAEAAAKRAENEATHAGWAAADASDNRERLLQKTDRNLDGIENALDAEHQTNIAILSNF